MKYSEFKAEVEKLGFTHSTRCVEIVVKVHGRTVMGVSTNREYIVDNEWDEFQSLHKKTQGKLFDLAYQLAKTPLAEREEEKRYRLRIVANLGFKDDQRFLNLNIEREDYFICSARQSEWVKTIFTESEIAEMDITGFEKIEVSND